MFYLVEIIDFEINMAKNVQDYPGACLLWIYGGFSCMDGLKFITMEHVIMNVSVTYRNGVKV